MCDLRACFDYVYHHVTCKQNNQLVATYIIGDWVGVLRGLADWGRRREELLHLWLNRGGVGT